jgi:hypothetical protein
MIHDYILEETPVENVVAMFDAVTEFGAYEQRGTQVARADSRDVKMDPPLHDQGART